MQGLWQLRRDGFETITDGAFVSCYRNRENERLGFPRVIDVLGDRTAADCGSRPQHESLYWEGRSLRLRCFMRSGENSGGIMMGVIRFPFGNNCGPSEGPLAVVQKDAAPVKNPQKRSNRGLNLSHGTKNGDTEKERFAYKARPAPRRPVSRSIGLTSTRNTLAYNLLRRSWSM